MNLKIKLIFVFLSFSFLKFSLAFDINSIIGEPTYKVFECKTDNSQTNPDECPRIQVATAKFKVLVDKSEVFISYTLLSNSKKNLIQLDDCKVIDKKNWKCGGNTSSYKGLNVNTLYIGYGYQMNDGQIETTDSYSSVDVVGFPKKILYGKAYKFIKN